MNFCWFRNEFVSPPQRSLEMFRTNNELLLLKMSVFQSLEMFQHELLLLKMSVFPESEDVST